MNSNSLRRIRALIKKEFFQIIRDPSSILISVVLPTILLFVYGYGVSLDMDHISIGIVLEDTSPDAFSFAKSLTDSRYFIAQVRRHRKEFEGEIIKGNIRGIVVIPSYFSQFRKRPDNIAPIQVIADGSEPNTASFVQNYVASAWQNWLQQESISSNLMGLSPINVETRFWYNPQLESRYFLMPGSIAIVMTLIGTLLTALVVAREWERGTMEALMSTPVKNSELILGKLIPYFCLGMLSMFICFMVSVFYYGVPFRGSIFVLTLVSSVFLLSALALGLLISTLSKNQFVAAQVAMVGSFLPSFILSGFIFEISTMPDPIRFITYFVPARYFVTSLLTLFLVGNVWKLLLINLFYMSLAALVLFLITSRKTTKHL